ncbi:MAG TPA: tyrosine-type recombinase/integrase [Anaerolineaceae bacterium]|nr:tyrosine-type recombinase/integrase [Anaerolineaceae bacterium]
MTQSTGKRRPHFKDVLPKDPAVKRMSEWPWDNRSFYERFLIWLRDSQYSKSARFLYGVAVRQAIGFLNKPYWTIDPETDLNMVWEHMRSRALRDSTLSDYHKGLMKFAEYLALRLQRPLRPKIIKWDHYLSALPEWLSQALRAYIHSRSRAWLAERRYERTLDALSTLTRFFRWMASADLLIEPQDITPIKWNDYLDERLSQGCSFGTVNGELTEIQSFLHFLVEEQEISVCERMFLLKRFPKEHNLPRDVPVERLQRLLEEIRAEAAAAHGGKRRCGRMDLAWFLLMLHSGLRTCEVRSLRFEDIDLQNKKIRIEQSKGLKDRIVYLSEPAIDAIEAYQGVRGPADALPEQLFIYAHKPLSESYCGVRLDTYARRCGVRITPHQLRHSCATLLLNAGAPVLTVQCILGHKWVDTTLGYARLYDGTVAAEYYSAMNVIEQRLTLPEDRLKQPPGLGYLVSLVDSLQQGTLNPVQTEAVRSLRNGLLLLVEKENSVVNVPK